MAMGSMAGEIINLICTMKLLNTPLYSVVVPVFNSSGTLLELQQRLGQVFSQYIQKPYEVIWVDDGSSNPATWTRIEEMVADHDYNSGIQLNGNFGQHAALMCGIIHAKGSYIITIDDDLQHAPEDIPILIKYQEHDVVMGQFVKRKHGTIRNMGSFAKSFFDWLISGKPKGLRVSTFCLIQRPVIDKMVTRVQAPLPLFSTILFKATRDIVGVQVSHSTRKEGKSGYTFHKLVKLFARMFARQSLLSKQSQPVFQVKQRIHQLQNIN